MIPIITERAASDIVGILDFLSEGNAKKIILEIEKVIEHLETFPYMGRTRDELRIGLRSLVIRQYVIFYVVWQETAIVLRVLHGSRDIEAVFQDDAHKADS